MEFVFDYDLQTALKKKHTNENQSKCFYGNFSWNQ